MTTPATVQAQKMYLQQKGTDRIYSFEEGLARREDMRLFVSGSEVTPNPYAQRRKKEDEKKMSPEQQQQMTELQLENSELRAALTSLTERVDAMTNAQPVQSESLTLTPGVIPNSPH